MYVICFYINVWKTWDFLVPKGVFMYSPEFMRFLINYQKPEYNENSTKTVKTFRFEMKNTKLAAVLLTTKK